VAEQAHRGLWVKCTRSCRQRAYEARKAGSGPSQPDGGLTLTFMLRAGCKVGVAPSGSFVGIKLVANPGSPRHILDVPSFLPALLRDSWLPPGREQPSEKLVSFCAGKPICHPAHVSDRGANRLFIAWRELGSHRKRRRVLDVVIDEGRSKSTTADDWSTEASRR